MARGHSTRTHSKPALASALEQHQFVDGPEPDPRVAGLAQAQVRRAIGRERDVDGTVEWVGDEATGKRLHDRAAIKGRGQAGIVHGLDDQFARVIPEAPVGSENPHARDVARLIEPNFYPFGAGLPLARDPSCLDVAVERTLQTIGGVARRGDKA